MFFNIFIASARLEEYAKGYETAYRSTEETKEQYNEIVKTKDETIDSLNARIDQLNARLSKYKADSDTDGIEGEQLN